MNARLSLTGAFIVAALLVGCEGKGPASRPAATVPTPATSAAAPRIPAPEPAAAVAAQVPVAAAVTSGWYGPEPFGRWASAPVSILELTSSKAQSVTLTFDVGAYVEPAQLEIKIGDQLIRRVEVTAKSGASTTPTKVSVTFEIPAGKSAVQLVGPDKTFVPQEQGDWADRRALRMAYSNMQLNGKKVF